MFPRILAFLLLSCSAFASESETIASLLARSIIDSNLPLAEIQAYTESRVPLMPDVSSVAEWEKV